MLPYLLATHPGTGADVLTALLNWPLAGSDTVAAALTHPNMPADVDVPTTAHVTASAAHQVLLCPRTTPSRRAQILAALDSSAVEQLIGEYTDLTTDEIIALVGRPSVISQRSSFALAVARNPASPAAHVELALLTLARTPTIHPLTIAILATERGARPDLGLTDALSVRAGGDVARKYFADVIGPRSHTTPIETALDSERRVLLTVIKQTGSIELLLRAIGANPAEAFIIRSYVPRDHTHHDLRTALDLADPPDAPRDTWTLEALEDACRLGTSTNLELLLTYPHLVPATLRTVHDALICDLEDPAFDRHAALLQIAAHPACPPDLLPAIGARTRDVPAPDPARGWRGEVTTYQLARAIIAGAPNPGLVVRTDQLPITDVVDTTVNHHHIRGALDAHPNWPPALADATTMLTLLEGFPGTLGELLQTTEAITA